MRRFFQNFSVAQILQHYILITRAMNNTKYIDHLICIIVLIEQYIIPDQLFSHIRIRNVWILYSAPALRK